MVAVGGEIKAAAAVASGGQAWLTQHIGDIENLATMDMLDRAVRLLAQVQRIEPELVVSDAHPGYLSRGFAQRMAAGRGIAQRLGSERTGVRRLMATPRAPVRTTAACQPGRRVSRSRRPRTRRRR